MKRQQKRPNLTRPEAIRRLIDPVTGAKKSTNGTPERIKVEDVARITGENKRTIQAAAARDEILGPGKLFKVWTFDQVKLRTWIATKEREALTRACETHGRMKPRQATPSLARTPLA
ncbi:hypothetical protein ACQPTN_06525 [Bradyrhizobium sp. 13971]